MWIVEYVEANDDKSSPQYFLCQQADNWAHAKEQCEDANSENIAIRVGKVAWVETNKFRRLLTGE